MRVVEGARLDPQGHLRAAGPRERSSSVAVETEHRVPRGRHLPTDRSPVEAHLSAIDDDVPPPAIEGPVMLVAQKGCILDAEAATVPVGLDAVGHLALGPRPPAARPGATSIAGDQGLHQTHRDGTHRFADRDRCTRGIAEDRGERTVAE